MKIWKVAAATSRLWWSFHQTRAVWSNKLLFTQWRQFSCCNAVWRLVFLCRFFSFIFPSLSIVYRWMICPCCGMKEISTILGSLVYKPIHLQYARWITTPITAISCSKSQRRTTTNTTISFHEDCRQTSLDDAFTEWIWMNGWRSCVIRCCAEANTKVAYKQNQHGAPAPRKAKTAAVSRHNPGSFCMTSRSWLPSHCFIASRFFTPWPISTLQGCTSVWENLERRSPRM